MHPPCRRFCSPGGAVVRELLGLGALVVDLPLGASRLNVANVVPASASLIEMTFRDVHPSGVRLDLSEPPA